MQADDKAIILYSGGRDSSLAACLHARVSAESILMNARTGATIETSILSVRTAELERAFPEHMFDFVAPHAAGIFRRIALASIESDFAKYRTNLILLGHQLAIQCEGIILALSRRVSTVVSGFSAYQSDMYMEQTPEAIGFSESLFESYGLAFETPIMQFESLDDVKFALLDFGVTTKSLESVSLFADTFSKASSDSILEYMHEKLPICLDYIERRTGVRPPSSNA